LGDTSEVCVIFDLDGTLVDSEELCNQAFVDLLPDLEETAEYLTTRYRGKKLSFILADLEQSIGHPLPPDFEPRYRFRVAELFDLHLRPTAGTREMLQKLDHPCCVASSGPPEKIAHALKSPGFRLSSTVAFSAHMMLVHGNQNRAFSCTRRERWDFHQIIAWW
jgi:beta-phosphoglucomutase-like phosphatase (HAD superfamily)